MTEQSEEGEIMATIASDVVSMVLSEWRQEKEAHENVEREMNMKDRREMRQFLFGDKYKSYVEGEDVNYDGHSDLSKCQETKFKEILEKTRVHVSAMSEVFFTKRCEDGPSWKCPACNCAKEWSNLKYRQNHHAIFSCQCCNDVYPRSAYELVEHAHIKARTCEYHRPVWRFLTLCAIKLADRGVPLSPFVKKILTRASWKNHKKFRVAQREMTRTVTVNLSNLPLTTTMGRKRMCRGWKVLKKG